MEVDSVPESQIFFNPGCSSTQQFLFGAPRNLETERASQDPDAHPATTEVIMENVNTQPNRNVLEDSDPLEGVTQPAVVKVEKLTQYSPYDSSVECIEIEGADEIIEVADETQPDPEKLLSEQMESNRPALVEDSFLAQKIARLNNIVLDSQRSSSSSETMTQNQSPKQPVYSTCELVSILQPSQDIIQTQNAQGSPDEEMAENDDDNLYGNVARNPNTGEWFFI